MYIHTGEYASWTVDAFADRAEKNYEISVVVTDNSHADISLVRDSALPSEGYALDITSDTIRLSAADDKGVIWGLATLYQLIVEAKQHYDSRLEEQTVQDWPKYSHRGLMIDVGRHFFDSEEMKKIIEEMSFYKLNVLHWHLTEDQGWRIESKIYPKLHEHASNGQYYTQEQIKNIVKYAQERGIDIIPEIDMPGHASAAISAYKELSCFDEEIPVATTYGVFRVVMCPGKESTYAWIRNLLEEVMALFPSRYFHLGGDECPKDKWKQCPHCNERMRQIGIESYENLQGYFMNEIGAYLRSKGKTVIGWNDILKAGNTANDTMVQYWLELTKESYVFPFFEAGQKMIFSDNFTLYFNSPHCMIKLKNIYEYQPKILQHTELQGDNIMGLEGAVWTEHIVTNEQLEQMISPRIQALAEASWTQKRDYEEFLERLKVHLENCQLSKLSSLPLEEVALNEEQAKLKALDYIKKMAAVTKEAYTDTGLTEEELSRMQQMLLSEVFGATDMRRLTKEMGID